MNDLISLYGPRRFFGPFAESLIPKTLQENFGITKTWIPDLDVTESDDGFVVKIDAPELDKNAIDIQINDGIVAVSGKRSSEKEETDGGRHIIERKTGAFSRSIRFTADIDAENVEAYYKDGVLRIVIPKSPDSKTIKKIPVKT